MAVSPIGKTEALVQALWLTSTLLTFVFSLNVSGGSIYGSLPSVLVSS